MVGHLFIMLLKGWGRERRGGRRKRGEISSSATDTKTCRKRIGHPTSRNANVACCCCCSTLLRITDPFHNKAPSNGCIYLPEQTIWNAISSYM